MEKIAKSIEELMRNTGAGGAGRYHPRRRDHSPWRDMGNRQLAKASENTSLPRFATKSFVAAPSL